MPKPYDATTKRLLELRPGDWIEFLGLPTGPVSLLDADLSTISLAADRLLRVDAAIPYIAHSEFESGKDTTAIPTRLLQYNVTTAAKYGLPVLSTVFLLQPRSDSPRITGELQQVGPDGAVYLSFRYRTIRIWQIEVESLLTGGLSLLPFAPIANTTAEQLPTIIQRMENRIDAEVEDDQEAGDLWTAAYVLMGLRYNREFNAQLLQGVRRMKESVTYQAILDEGRAEGERRGELRGEYRALIRVGTKRLGPPPTSVENALLAITSVERLESLLDRITEVESWEELISG